MDLIVNPYAELARRDKAVKLADFLVRCCPMTGDEAARLRPEGRRAAERLAGVPTSSDATWGIVADELRRIERRQP